YSIRFLQFLNCLSARQVLLWHVIANTCLLRSVTARVGLQMSMLFLKRQADSAQEKRKHGWEYNETMRGVIVRSLLLLYRGVDDNPARTDGQSKS
ncbi:hypothetical protein F5141DRAFT_1107746, partial [Pisolithus sp. B1]